MAWTAFCFGVAAGAHTYRWEYAKDGSTDDHGDSYSIDDVRLPPGTEICDDGNLAPGDGCDARCRSE